MRTHKKKRRILLTAFLASALWAPRVHAQTADEAESTEGAARESGVRLHAGISSAAVARASAGDTGAAGGHLDFGFWSVPGAEKEPRPGARGWPFTSDGWKIRGGVHANAHALSCLSCDEDGKLPPSLQTVERFSLRSGYLNLSQWAGYQRSGRFDDTYWRPAERQGQVGFGLEMPGVLRWNGRTGLVAAEASYNALVEPDSTDGARYDVGAHLRLFDVVDRHRHSSFRGRILGIELRNFATPTALDPTESEHRPTDVRLYVLDTEGITFDQGRHTFGFAWGKRTLTPAHAPPDARQDGGPTSSAATDLQFSFTRHGAGRHRWSDGRRPTPFVRDVRYRVGTGSFARIGPTGFGIDRGWKLELDGALPLAKRWALRGEAVGVAASRTHVADRPNDVTVVPEGTRLLLGRAELAASHWLGERIAVELSVWGERSDRFEPNTHSATRFGGGSISNRVGASAALTTKIF